MKKNVLMIFFCLILLGTVNADQPDDPGTVSSIVDANYNTKVYPGEEFIIRAKLLDGSSNPLEGQFCTLEIKDKSGLEEGRSLIERIETKEDCVIGIEDCYYLSDSGGIIWMTTKIDFKYQPGHSFEGFMVCDDQNVTANFVVDNTPRDLTTRSYTFLLFIRENIITVFFAVIAIVVLIVLIFGVLLRK